MQTSCDQKHLKSNVQTPEWAKDAIIYEVNIRQYTAAGTFNAFTEHLPRLKEMGVDILWLMPIHPVGVEGRKGTLGSYYAVKDYKAVNPEFGTFEDFRELVRKAHDLGLKVIIDWVANHSAPDNHWMKTNPEWYTRDASGNWVPPVEDWSDVADLNYDAPGLADAMIDAMAFWVSEANIDGFRCDVADMVPVTFWDKARKSLDQIKPVFMLAESEKPELQVNAFDANYAWELHHVFNHIAQGKSTPDALEKYFKSENYYAHPFSSWRMSFTSNHDENSWNGTEFERLGDAAQTMAVLTYTLPGFPLIYTGQEEPIEKRLEFFEKDPIEFKNYGYMDFYKRLNFIKKKYAALHNGHFGSPVKFLTTDNPNVIAFQRESAQETVNVIANLSDVKSQVKALKVFQKDFADPISSKVYQLSKAETFEFTPWEIAIFVQKK